MDSSMQIVNEFGAYLLDNPSNDIRDASLLPYPKETIKKAILTILEENENIENFGTLRDALYLLADFQEGVGDIPSSALGLDISKTSIPETDEEWIDLASKMASNPNQERFPHFNNLVQKDRASFKLQLEELASRKLLNKKITQPNRTTTSKDTEVIVQKKKSPWSYFVNIFIIILMVLAVIESIYKLEQPLGLLAFISFFLALLFTPPIGKHLLSKRKAQ